jgi:glycosyltransferase involved in cell wall biosynthesis
VHAHFGLSGLMATLAAIGLKAPVVVTYHGCDINDSKNRPFSKIAIRLAAWNVFVSSRQIANAFKTKKISKRYQNWSIIPCGVDIEAFDGNKVDIDWFNSRYPVRNKILFAGSFW